MSTGRRLAKRSIIGTKVCALGADGLWYSGIIQDVKSSAPNATITTVSENSQASETCSETKYIVRFDFKTQIGEISERDYAGNNSLLISPAQTLRRNAMIKEFRETELIGPGFRSIIDIQLQSGQRVYVTHNGRETSGDVVQHNAAKDEVMLKITPMGCEEPIVLKKRLEEVRLLESRRSARLAYQERNTDFARLADMGGGEKRRSSYTIDVPSSSISTGIVTACPPTTAFTPQYHSRKRPPSTAYECFGCETLVDEEEMNECNAAMILVTLSLSPKSPKNGEKWLASSPGSSSASWSSGSSSPPLSDDGNNVLGATSTNDATSNARNRTTSVSTSDEGIVVDFKEETPRKKRANKTKFVCTFPGCKLSEHTKTKIERHIRMVHLGSQKKPRRSLDQNDDYFVDSDSHEEEFYYTEIEDDDDDYKTPSPASPPTLSHRDMARPPHEDPEYQRQIVGNFKQGRITQQQQIIQKNHSKALQSNVNSLNQQQRQLQNNNNNNLNCMATSPLAYHNYTWPPNNATSVAPISPVYISNNAVLTLQQQQQQQQQPTQTIIKHTRTSPSQSITPYPSPTYVHQQHHNYSSSVANSNGTIIQQYHDSSSSSNGMLQQLSQHNITVTARHGSNNGHQQPPQHHHQQQQHLATVTITPNYGPHTVRTGTKPHEASLQQQQQQQQQQPHQQQISTATGNIGVNKTTTTPIANTNAGATVVASLSTGNLQQTQSGPNKHTPNSPNRRTRGENKKCRKVYGMDRRELWCTQCRWKKACSRFGD